MSSDSQNKNVAATSTAATTASLNRADAVRLTRATFLSGTNMMAVPSAVRREHVRKGGTVSFCVQLHSIANGSAELHRVSQNPRHGTRGDIHDIVDRTPAVGIATDITGQESQPFLLSYWSGSDTRVQPQ